MWRFCLVSAPAVGVETVIGNPEAENERLKRAEFEREEKAKEDDYRAVERGQVRRMIRKGAACSVMLNFSSIGGKACGKAVCARSPRVSHG